MIPFKADEPFWTPLIQALVAVAVLCAMALAALWAAQRRGALKMPLGQRRLRVLERLVLGRGAALVLIEYEGRRILVGQTAQGFCLLDSAVAERPAAPS
jgi:flagellar biogenesis protein FliO